MRFILWLIAYITGWPQMMIVFKPRIFYEDKKVQKRKIKGKAIILSNHINVFEYMINMFLFPFRKLYCLVGELAYRKHKTANYFVSIFGGIKVDRINKDMGFIGEAVKVLNKGKLLQIFPEGGFSPTKQIMPFKPSYVMIALKSGAPIVPVVTDGNYGVFKRVNIIIGKPINLYDHCKTENPDKDEIERLNKIVRDKVIALKNMLEEKNSRKKISLGLSENFFGIWAECLYVLLVFIFL